MSYEFISRRTLPSFRHFTLRAVSGALGAEISGINIAAELPQAAVDELHAALLEFKVLFFRDQPLDDAAHVAFTRRFGVLQGPGAIPAVDGFPMLRHQQYDEMARMGSDVNFHCDDSFRNYPSKFSVLRALEVPPCGGDTIWVDMEKAYHTLSPLLQSFLEGLTVEHTVATDLGLTILRHGGGRAYDDMMRRNPPVVHPLICTHPDTGRRCIYANELLSSRIMELSASESRALLDQLFRLSYRPEFQCRFRWERNSVAMWDNRSTQHRGIDDFYPAFRAMRRIPVVDDRRPSLHPEKEPRRDWGGVPYVRTEDLFDHKPDLGYGAPAAKPAGDGEGEGDPEAADPLLLADLNSRVPGLTFTAAAAARIGKIPPPFRGSALSQIVGMARKKGLTQVDLPLLDEINGNRRAG